MVDRRCRSSFVLHVSALRRVSASPLVATYSRSYGHQADMWLQHVYRRITDLWDDCHLAFAHRPSDSGCSIWRHRG